MREMQQSARLNVCMECSKEVEKVCKSSKEVWKKYAEELASKYLLSYTREWKEPFEKA